MPGIELEPDLGKRPDVLETESLMQPNTAFVRQGNFGIRRAIAPCSPRGKTTSCQSLHITAAPKAIVNSQGIALWRTYRALTARR